MKKLYSIISFIIFLIIVFYYSLSAAEFGLIRNAIEAKGQWKRGIVLEREVIFTDKKGDISEIKFEVPRDGFYQLYAYVYHNWRDFFPFIYFEGVDSKGVEHKSYMFFERCWYLDEGSHGRWFIHSPNSSFWFLPEGKFSLKFWIEGKASNWEQKDTEIKDIVAIETFFLIPVLFTDKEIVSMNIIEPEIGIGSWRFQHYSKEFGTGIISTSLPDEFASLDFYIPTSGRYLLAVSMYANKSNKIELIFENKNFSKKFTAKNQLNKSSWKLNLFDPFYIDKGWHSVRFRNRLTNTENSKVAIDYLLFIPCN